MVEGEGFQGPREVLESWSLGGWASILGDPLVSLWQKN